MKDLNRMRMAAGIAIDPSIEITEPKAVETINEAAAMPMTDFCIVGAATADSALSDVFHCTNLRGLINIIKSAKKADLDALQVFHHRDEAAAQRIAKKLIKAAKETADVEPVAEAVVTEAECEDCKAMHRDDANAQAAWKLKMQADALQKQGKTQMAQQYLSGAKSHLDRYNKVKDTLKCDNCKPAVNESEALEEFVIGAKNLGFQSWEEDEQAATNAVAPNKDAVASDNTRETDKDESPRQLDEPGDLGNATDNQGYDMDKKINVPAKITKLLKDEIKQAEDESKKLNYTNRDASHFYKDLAAAFQDLLNHLEGGTVYDIKQAQIFMTSLMGPMMHKIPADVVNYIARGGMPASLKSYMNKV